MDNNTSIPNSAETLLASSNGFQQPTPPQPPDKKRILNEKGIISIGTILVTDPRTGDSYERSFQLPDDIETLMDAIQREDLYPIPHSQLLSL